MSAAASSSLDQSSRQVRPYPYLRRRLWNMLLLGAADAISLSLALIVSGAVRRQWLGATMLSRWSALLIPVWWIATWGARLLPSWGLGAVEELRRLIVLLGTLFGGVMVLVFVTKTQTEVSRFVLLLAFALSTILVPTLRALVKRALFSRGLWGVPIAVYGDTDAVRRVINTLRANAGFGYVPIGVFSDALGRRGDQLAGVPVLGGLRAVTPLAPVAILVQQELAREQVQELLDGPLAAYRKIVLIPDLFDMQSLWVSARDLGGVVGLEIPCKLLDPVAQTTKRSLELAAVVATVWVWAPVCLLITLLIWLYDRANPFFVQERVGKDGRMFRAWKFRTMVPNAEEVLQRRFAEDEAARLEFQTNMKLRNDPRITRIGRLLRKTSLDELPQLVNVLRGEMSLVGPRPVPAYNHKEFSAQGRLLRERVAPGMTGLWQVSDRAEPGPSYMERWDSYYVRNWSIWLDIVILARTLGAMARGDSHGTPGAERRDAPRPTTSVEQQIPLRPVLEPTEGLALSRLPVDSPSFDLTAADGNRPPEEVAHE